MLSCCAGICGAQKSEKSNGESKRRPKGESGVQHPVLRLDEPDILHASVEDLIGIHQLQAAPPDADPPVALVSPDFRKNSQRLLVLVPSVGAPFGSWDPDLESGCGATVPMMQWAEANGYAAVLFSAAALASAPSESWDRIMMGSPAKYVVVAAAGKEGLLTLHACLAPLHSLLYSRIRTVFTGAAALGGALPEKPPELRGHLRGAQVQWPEDGFQQLEPRLVRRRLIELALTREDNWQKQETTKYSGLQNLKENDIPGIRRLDWQQRVARLDRDRNTDELSQLIQKHTRNSNGNNDEEEPGVD
mmetsp:Transcript_58104/g.101721  ORF Transcript_58104/g.101721 Transcript_58104/m.101721 type:complete len:304 (-) Transcript_58104:69-980(-)